MIQKYFFPVNMITAENTVLMSFYEFTLFTLWLKSIIFASGFNYYSLFLISRHVGVFSTLQQ